jgi:double-stranded RNA binding protein
VGEHLYLGKGIAKGGGRSLKSLLANAFEAILGAIFLDAGYDAAYHFYLDRFRRLPEPVKDENHKGRLQQLVQERFNQTPFYDSAGSRSGNRREYTAVVFAGPEALGSGHGHTKQEAEQDAARAALESLTGTAALPQPKPLVQRRTPRTPRAPRKKREPQPKAEDSAAPPPGADIIVPLPSAQNPAPAPEPAREAEPERPEPPPRSRQFGEPIED